MGATQSAYRSCATACLAVAASAFGALGLSARASASTAPHHPCGYVDLDDGAVTGSLSARGVTCAGAQRLVWKREFKGGTGGRVTGTRWGCGIARAGNPGGVLFSCGWGPGGSNLEGKPHSLIVRKVRGVIRCTGFTQVTPAGDFVYKGMRISVLGGASCASARSVLRQMVLDDTVLGGGYGDHRTVGSSGGFTCRSRKAAVHYQEMVCVAGKRRIHGFLAGDFVSS